MRLAGSSQRRTDNGRWSLWGREATSVSLVGGSLNRDPRQGMNEPQRCQGKSMPDLEQQQ